MTEPIKPQDVIEAKLQIMPDEVIECFNHFIAANWNGHSAVIKQCDIVGRIVGILNLEPKDRKKIYDNHWLDVEDIYRKQGWIVKYDKPAYNESYEATFEFAVKT